MPELPEVEAVRRLLERRVTGARIRDVSVVAPKILKGSEPPAFVAALRGATLVSVQRRGKYLILHLRAPGCGSKTSDREADGEYDLVAHLGMRGRVRIEQAPDPPGKWLCLEIRLEGGRSVRYYDDWGWGVFTLLPRGTAAARLPALAKIGPEPDSPEFTAEWLAHELHGRRAPVKAVLLSQGPVAGIGNIYADECLNRARIHPARPCAGLSSDEIARLRSAIVATIAEAVARGGAVVERIAKSGENLDDYNEVYTPRVYNQPGKPCPLCGRPLIKYKLQGRGTTFCPYCQPGVDGVARA